VVCEASEVMLCQFPRIKAFPGQSQVLRHWMAQGARENRMFQKKETPL
jgi:hypothetical protein